MRKKDELFNVVISELDLFIINKVKEIRTTKNISQVNLAILLNFAEGLISKVENPRQRAKYSIRHLNLLARVLHCSPRDLLPEKVLTHDLVKVTFKARRNKSGSKAVYEIVKMEPFLAGE